MRTIIRNDYTPEPGDYHERIVIDETRGKQWLFDCDGVFTDITGSDIEIANEFGDKTGVAISQKFFTDTVETEITAREEADTTLAGDILAERTARTNADAALQAAVSAEQTARQNADASLQDQIDDIEEVIPNQASASNQLADKNFVNSSVATNTANYISNNGQPFNSLAELEAYSGPLTNNDYAFVTGTDAQGNTFYDRYKYNANTGEWAFEYELNNSSFTANQWAAINSGITSGDVSKLQELANIKTIGSNLSLDANGELSATNTTYSAGTGLNLTGTTFSVDTTTIAAKSDLPTKTSDLTNDGADGTSTYVETDELATVATSGSYTDLSNTPTIPTVNNATLTVTQNGTSAGTFTANSSTDTTIALTDTTYSNYTGATSQTAGTAGLVPAPAAGDETKFLSGNGAWTTVSQYALPIASANDLGGIKVGTDLSIDSSTGVLSAINTGKAKLLTSADYNYDPGNTGTNTAIALWKLTPGLYSWSGGMDVQAQTNLTTGNAGVAQVWESNSGFMQIQTYSNADFNYVTKVNATTGAAASTAYPIALGAPTVVQTTGTSTTDVMSQNATTAMVFADPSTKQKVQIGTYSSASGSSSIAIGSLGNSSYPTASKSAYGIAIGAGAKVNTGSGYSVTIGTLAASSNTGAIALGAYSNATQKGQVDIGSTNTSYGYNNSAYRLLTGLYDGQSNHDAATKGQLDGVVLTNAGAPTTATVGTVGQLLEDTTNGALYQCTAVTPGTDPDPTTYTWEEVGGTTIATINSTDWSNLWQ